MKLGFPNGGTNHNWSTADAGFRLFRRDRQGKQSRGVVLCGKIERLHRAVTTGWEHMGKNKGPSQQGKPHGWCWLQATWQRGACWQSILNSTARNIVEALILQGDFSCSAISWKSSPASCKESRRLLECIEDNFLVQVIAQREKCYWTCCSPTQMN